MFVKYTAVLLGLTVCLSPISAAEVYKNVDAEGNVTYTDEPSSDAVPIDVDPAPTVTLPKAEQVRKVIEAGESGQGNQQQAQVYDSATFSAPEDESAFWAGHGSVAFAVSSSPALRNGHRYEVTLDGQPIGQNTSGRFTLDSVNRGTHEASVNIIGSGGDIVYSGETISFTLHQPSVLN
jgi:hypothetical protein